ncbi:hypothetical protein MSKU15_1428 [Komagataeibacter diospyri]|nr:hypothetical protein MSKU15_1428 [Komagataeibacter diospyri]
MGKKNAVSGRHLHPVGQDDPFGTWVKTSLSQQFADVTAEPIPDKLLEILLFSPEVGDNPPLEPDQPLQQSYAAAKSK